MAVEIIEAKNPNTIKNIKLARIDADTDAPKPFIPNTRSIKLFVADWKTTNAIMYRITTAQNPASIQE